MAGDWIKIEHSLPDKPEVVQMATFLGIDQDLVVGKLVRFWSWADQNSSDGNEITVTKAFLDRYTFCPGFSDALLKVNWLQARSGSFVIPHFARHNGQTAKARLETSRRVSEHRAKKAKIAHQDVTKECYIGNENSVTKSVTKALLEKRREELEMHTPPLVRFLPGQRPNSLDEVILFSKTPHCGGLSEQQCSEFWNHYECNGWTVNGVPINDWRAGLRKWKANQAKHERKNGTSNGSPQSGNGKSAEIASGRITITPLKL